jgi:hypothetical protein
VKSLYVIFNEEHVLENVNPFNIEERNNYFTDYELLQNEVGDGITVIPPYLGEVISTSYPLSSHQMGLPYSFSSTPTYSSSASPLDPSLFSDIPLQHHAETSSPSSLETSSSSPAEASSSSPTQDDEEVVSHPAETGDGMRLRDRKSIDYRPMNSYGTVFSVRDVEELETPSTYTEAMQGDLSDL